MQGVFVTKQILIFHCAHHSISYQKACIHSGIHAYPQFFAEQADSIFLFRRVDGKSDTAFGNINKIPLGDQSRFIAVPIENGK